MIRFFEQRNGNPNNYIGIDELDTKISTVAVFFNDIKVEITTEKFQCPDTKKTITISPDLLMEIALQWSKQYAGDPVFEENPEIVEEPEPIDLSPPYRVDDPANYDPIAYDSFTPPIDELKDHGVAILEKMEKNLVPAAREIMAIAGYSENKAARLVYNSPVNITYLTRTQAYTLYDSLCNLAATVRIIRPEDISTQYPKSIIPPLASVDDSATVREGIKDILRNAGEGINSAIGRFIPNKRED